MPISKAEAESRAADPHLSVYEEFCERIDKAIKANADRGGGGAVIVANDRTPQAIVYRALEAYAKLGWTCKYEVDPRDGDYIALT